MILRVDPRRRIAPPSPEGALGPTVPTDQARLPSLLPGPARNPPSAPAQEHRAHRHRTPLLESLRSRTSSYRKVLSAVAARQRLTVSAALQAALNRPEAQRVRRRLPSQAAAVAAAADVDARQCAISSGSSNRNKEF